MVENTNKALSERQESKTDRTFRDGTLVSFSLNASEAQPEGYGNVVDRIVGRVVSHRRDKPEEVLAKLLNATWVEVERVVEGGVQHAYHAKSTNVLTEEKNLDVLPVFDDFFVDESNRVSMLDFCKGKEPRDIIKKLAEEFVAIQNPSLERNSEESRLLQDQCIPSIKLHFYHIIQLFEVEFASE